MSTLDAWTARVVDELGVEQTVDVELVLDLAKVVAHGIVRPAAPLTTYLLGIAVGRGADPVQAARQVSRLLELPPP